LVRGFSGLDQWLEHVDHLSLEGSISVAVLNEKPGRGVCVRAMSANSKPALLSNSIGQPSSIGCIGFYCLPSDQGIDKDAGERAGVGREDFLCWAGQALPLHLILSCAPIQFGSVGISGAPS
jgi:hypothetical protein